jgi:hypothetical protein
VEPNIDALRFDRRSFPDRLSLIGGYRFVPATKTSNDLRHAFASLLNPRGPALDRRVR